MDPIIRRGVSLPSFLYSYLMSEDTYMRMWEANKQLCPHAPLLKFLAIYSYKRVFLQFDTETIQKIKQNYRMNISKTSTLQYKLNYYPPLFCTSLGVLNLFAGVAENLPMPMAEGLVLYFERT